MDYSGKSVPSGDIYVTSVADGTYMEKVTARCLTLPVDGRTEDVGVNIIRRI